MAEAHPAADAPLRILLVHAVPLSRCGGAELSLAHHVANAPASCAVDVVAPDFGGDLAGYDAVVLANLRPEGGVGETGERAPAFAWRERLAGYRGFSLRSERDLHPCGFRDARCLVGDPLVRLPCACRRVPRAFEALYNACSAVQYLSPLHRAAIRRLVRVEVPEHVIAAPVDLARFRCTTPPEARAPEALILGDAIRVAPGAEARARRAGYEPVRIPYLSVPPAEMPALYNRFRAVVVDPVMLHAFGRVAVEALACGCKVLASERVGAFSFEDPLAASRAANGRFWSVIAAGARAAREARA